ncbi:MAG: SpoIIIAC/SpoIIIAD family protein [Eubacteriales bacterium]|nr:SpoIIIAC/SpoIIIAD family protein [Eubacteriales bacterium]
MSIVSICAVAIVTIVLVITLRRHNQELSILISIGAAVIILLCVIEYVLTCIDSVTTILADANISAENIMILIKVIGICFLTEFTCDCTKEAGLHSLSSNISLAGKVIVLVTAMPLFTNILNVVKSLSTGDTSA